MAEAPVGESPAWIYLPYVDERATGLQRYASQMILALKRTGLRFELIIGELHGEPAWLSGISHRVAIARSLSRRLPRPLLAFARLLWLQILFPLKVGRARRGTLLALGHELPPFPRQRQIAVVHDLTDFKSFSGRNGPATRARNALWKAGLRRSEIVVAISNATRSDLLDTFQLDPDRVCVVHEGVDFALFKPLPAEASSTPTRPFLLYAGTLDPHKNIPFLLDVYRRLRNELHDIELKLVGRHDPRRANAMLETIPPHLRGDVEFVGFVTDEALAEKMSRCAAFVFPSRNEGFGLAPVEAMACGAPVVAADAGSLPEVVGAGGTLLSPDDAESWVAELKRLLTDETYRQHSSARALARSRAFSWAEAAEAYRSLIAPPAGPS
jgi:glycosyltransferase involved in cell wall biosynthesis